MTIRQHYIGLGKSTGYEVSTVPDALATAIIPDGCVGISIGSAVVCGRPLAHRYADSMAGAMKQHLRFKGQAAIDQYRFSINPATGVVTEDATSVGGDALVTCAINLGGSVHTKSGPVDSGLTQCLEVLKETWSNLG